MALWPSSLCSTFHFFMLLLVDIKFKVYNEYIKCFYEEVNKQLFISCSIKFFNEFFLWHIILRNTPLSSTGNGVRLQKPERDGIQDNKNLKWLQMKKVGVATN